MKTKPILIIVSAILVCALIVSVAAYLLCHNDPPAQHVSSPNSIQPDASERQADNNNIKQQTAVTGKFNQGAFWAQAKKDNPHATPDELNRMVLDEIKRRAAAMTPDEQYGARMRIREQAIARNNARMKTRKAELDKDYAVLFSRLALPEKEIDLLKDLIVKLEFAGREAWSDPRFSLLQRPSAEEVRAVAAEYMQAYNNNVKNLIGDEQFEVFAHYLETLVARRSCEVITSRFAYEAEPLTPAARESFIDIIHESFNAFNSSGLPGADHIVRFDFLKNKILELAQPVLTPSQLKSIENYYIERIQGLKEQEQATREWYNEKMKKNNQGKTTPQ